MLESIRAQDCNMSVSEMHLYMTKSISILSSFSISCEYLLFYFETIQYFDTVIKTILPITLQYSMYESWWWNSAWNVIHGHYYPCISNKSTPFYYPMGFEKFYNSQKFENTSSWNESLTYTVVFTQQSQDSASRNSIRLLFYALFMFPLVLNSPRGTPCFST